jgi:hypothetical protein
MVGTIRERDAGEKIAARIRSILASRDLTLHRVSAESQRLYGPSSPFCIPHTLYHSLQNSPLFGPSLAQTCALSRITGYRIEDWLAVLGIDLEIVAGLQAALPLKRTRLVDPPFEHIAFPTGDIEEPWIRRFSHRVLPLGQVLRGSNGQSLQRSQSRGPTRHSLFAKIGSEDAFAFPELLPGSIVRVNPDWTDLPADRERHGSRPPLLLIEHERGLWCGRFHVAANRCIHASASELSFAQVSFQSPQEATILGMVDLEIRWIHRFEKPRVPAEFATWVRPRALPQAPVGLGALIRHARIHAGLTLREASLFSRQVSQLLNDQQFAIAQSTLSEYEVQNIPPRHLEKALSLCLIYGIQLTDLAVASGTAAEYLGHHFMPEDLVPRSRPAFVTTLSQSLPQGDDSPDTLSFSSAFGNIPWFLGGSLATLSGIPHPSLRDFLALVGDQSFLPAYTQGSIVALVDRRKKRPVRIPNSPSWQQPAWVLLLRNGEYGCACCELDRDTLMLYPESDRTRSTELLRIGRDAEVIGQIVAVARNVES